jgi:nucleolar GTP-binding protein
MYKIPTILTPEEILDKAFKSASKVQVVAKDRTRRRKKIAIAKVRKASNTISSTLNRYVKSFPNFDDIPQFYYELFDVSVGLDEVRRSLGRVDSSRRTVKDIANEVVKRISRSKGKDGIKIHVTSAYGRFSSVLNQISGDLEFLASAREKMIHTPAINPELPTIVIAGAPNVGKSLLVRKISSARPEIAPYPFTTKGISVGHFDSDGTTLQVIDTPGLLDRETEKRNEMELKAILALRHLANVIVFIIDPSEHCGYVMDSQLRILSDIKARFPEVPIIEVENKVDILRYDSTRLKISALESEGVEALMEILFVIYFGQKRGKI